MPKTPKINVITVKLTCHIPVDPGDINSVEQAADYAERLRAVAAELGQTSVESRLARVAAPEPAVAELDIPAAPERRAETVAA